MSVLSDYFQALANKIRSKTGKSDLLSVTDMVSEVDTVYDTGETSGIAETKVGTAVAGDVLTGKTFTNASSVGTSGSMANNGAVSKTLDATTGNQSYTVPAGYHNGSGSVGITLEEKSCTPSASAQTITPTSGKVLSKVSVGAVPTQTKSATPKSTAQTITPDSGKLLSSVSISGVLSHINNATDLWVGVDKLSYTGTGYIVLTNAITSTGVWLVSGVPDNQVAQLPTDMKYIYTYSTLTTDGSTYKPGGITFLFWVTDLSKVANIRVRFLSSTGGMQMKEGTRLICFKICDI